MGYDLHYEQTRAFTAEEWDALGRDLAALVRISKRTVGPLVHDARRSAGRSARATGAGISPHRITFCGKRPNGVEDFDLRREPAEWDRTYCVKTNRFPYDMLAKAFLLVVLHRCPGALRGVYADGRRLEDWAEALALADRYLALSAHARMALHGALGVADGAPLSVIPD